MSDKPNSGHSPRFPGEFERFDSAVRRLFAVPKAEIDKKEAVYQRKKAARKKRKGK